MPTDIEKATVVARDLAHLIRERLPIDCNAERWPALAWALLARMAATTESVIALTPDRSPNDGWCLVRVLYEHAVMMAWIAAGPVGERVDLLRKHDVRKRLAADNDFRDIGEHLLEQVQRTRLEAFRDSITGELPKLPQLAEAADVYWRDRVDEFVEDSSSPYSFRGMYRRLYRHASSIVHPSLLGMNRVTTLNPDDTRSIHMEVASEPPFPIGLAAVVLGAAVIVSEHALGWPPVGSVDDIVADHHWLPSEPESE